MNRPGMNRHVALLRLEITGQKILLGVCGGIAAYKSADLLRRLRDQGAEVRVVMTQSAQHFILLQRHRGKV